MINSFHFVCVTIWNFAGESGVLLIEFIAEIRRRHLVSIDRISSIARDLNLSRPTVCKHLLTETEPAYVRVHQACLNLGEFSHDSVV